MKSKPGGYYEQALTIAREIGDRDSEGIWLGSLGVVYRSLGEYEIAINFLEQGLSILEEIKSPDAEYYQQLLDDIEQESDGKTIKIDKVNLSY